jgi:hypothetical protein
MKILVQSSDHEPHLEWEGDLMWACFHEGPNPPQPEDGLEWVDFQGYTVHQIL